MDGVLEELKKVKDVDGFLGICKKIFGLPENAKQKEVANALGVKESLISQRKDLKNHPFISQENFDLISSSIAKKLEVNQDEMDIVLQNIPFLLLNPKYKKKSKEKMEENLSDEDPYLKDLLDKLKKDVSYVIDQLEYEWKKDQPKNSEYEGAIFGKIKIKDDASIIPKTQGKKERLRMVLAFSISDANYEEVAGQIADLETEKQGLIIVCCEDQESFQRVLSDERLKKDQYILAKIFGEDNSPFVVSHRKHRGHFFSMIAGHYIANMQ